MLNYNHWKCWFSLAEGIGIFGIFGKKFFFGGFLAFVRVLSDLWWQWWLWANTSRKTQPMNNEWNCFSDFVWFVWNWKCKWESIRGGANGRPTTPIHYDFSVQIKLEIAFKFIVEMINQMLFFCLFNALDWSVKTIRHSLAIDRSDGVLQRHQHQKNPKASY